MGRRTTGDRPPRAKLIVATLDLLRRSGLSGAGINQVVDASRAPKGSVYHYFPGGKEQLVTEALQEAERIIGSQLKKTFQTSAPLSRKVRTLFTDTAAWLEANNFMKGCPVAAVTLDLDENTRALREICESVFDRFVNLIAAGLENVPSRERRAVAQLIFATFEGSLVLSRAQDSTAPLLESGGVLATVLEARFASTRRRNRSSTAARLTSRLVGSRPAPWRAS